MNIEIPKKKTTNGLIPVTINNQEGKLKVDYPTMVQEQHLQDILYASDHLMSKDMIKYQQYYIKYTVKGQDNLPIEIKLDSKPSGTEWNDEQWWSIVKNHETRTLLFAMIREELEVTVDDLKK